MDSSGPFITFSLCRDAGTPVGKESNAKNAVNFPRPCTQVFLVASAAGAHAQRIGDPSTRGCPGVFRGGLFENYLLVYYSRRFCYRRSA